MSPPSQRYRQIGFRLDGGPGDAVRLDLAIRPEDLNVSEPSRLLVQQTLGGAWADAFDRGLVTINLSGTLGWRGGIFLSGEDAFAQLRSTVFLAWHQRRADAIQQGIDPTDVELTFVDTLDNLTYIVAPQQFTLLRSKSSPLLMRYQIRLVALSDADAPTGLLDQISAALSNPLRWLAGVTGVGNIMGTLQSYYDTGMNLYGQFSSAVQGVLSTGMSILGSVQGVASQFSGVFTGANASLLTVGRAFAQAASNAFAALEPDDLPAYLLIPANRLASLFTDADCTMANSFSAGYTYPSFDSLFGASTCSSTGGGDPASAFTVQQLNPFDLILPPETPAVTVSAEATAAMAALRGDPLLLVGRNAYIAQQLAIMSAGVQVAA